MKWRLMILAWVPMAFTDFARNLQRDWNAVTWKNCNYRSNVSDMINGVDVASNTVDRGNMINNS